jgi:hypothetical protein
VAVVEPAHPRRNTSSGFPPLWARAVIYGFTWLPVIVIVIGIVPRFESVFQKIQEKGELPRLTHWLMALVQMDAACLHLPIVLGAVALLIIDEAAVRVFRQRATGTIWAWLWLLGAFLAGLAALFVIGVGLLLPVYKLGSAIDEENSAANRPPYRTQPPG